MKQVQVVSLVLFSNPILFIRGNYSSPLIKVRRSLNIISNASAGYDSVATEISLNSHWL